MGKGFQEVYYLGEIIKHNIGIVLQNNLVNVNVNVNDIKPSHIVFFCITVSFSVLLYKIRR